MIFGVISDSTRMQKVTPALPIHSAHSFSPSVRNMMTVNSAADRLLTKLFPSSTTPSNRSVRSRRAAAMIAPRLPVLTRWRSR